MKYFLMLTLACEIMLSASAWLGFGQSKEIRELKADNLAKDSVIIAQAKYIVATLPIVDKPTIHDTIREVYDSIVYKKKIITMPLTTADSDRIGNIKYSKIQKEKVDSFIDKAKKRSYDIQVKEGVDNDK